jgi:hypothetical protein
MVSIRSQYGLAVRPGGGSFLSHLLMCRVSVVREMPSCFVKVFLSMKIDILTLFSKIRRVPLSE